MEHHEIRAYHNSYQTEYRNPFGAVLCGQDITLKLEILSDAEVDDCCLRVWEEDSRETVLPMRFIRKHKENGSTKQIYEIGYQAPADPGLVWYYFVFRSGSATYYYGDNKDKLGGQGELSEHLPKSYQITVHKAMKVPDWYKDGIMYQIFVDRFRNGYPNGEVRNVKKNSMIHGHWNDNPFYIKTPDGKIARWNFFGGNLRGVIEKLPYLEELGISILYLNPIFEAASNHKYDTADYYKIDPMFGDEEDFLELVEKARERGISILLDGVFSHTGSDSLYFNRYGSYPGLGAYQSDQSPYHSWYRFKDNKIRYDSWWGIEDLPTINKDDPTFREFIFGGEDSVARHWIRKGARGWRLDVVDELPDDFVKDLRIAVKKTDPEAVLIGEVWEDASHKISYGRLREYFWGDELDAVMNYPLRSILLDFLLGRAPAGLAAHRIFCLLENYPKENFNANMNLIGSHDKERILTLLGEAPDPAQLTEEQKAAFRLSPEARRKAVARLKVMALFQMTMPGVPCIYYGDEAGLEGYADPYNRGTYPWGREDRELLDWYKKLTTMRREYPLFNDGLFAPLHRGDDVFGLRIRKGEEEILVYHNRSVETEAKIHCESCNGKKQVLELLTGEKIHGNTMTLEPLGSKVLYIRRHPEGMKELEKRSGILLHISSLPSKWGLGDLGMPAMDFVDFLEEAGQTLWQILPLNPTGQGNSPYQSPSVFAGNTSLISLEDLAEEGLLSREDLESALGKRKASEERTDYQGAAAAKEKLLKKAFYSFLNQIAKAGKGGFLSLASFKKFQEEQKFWLEDYCLYEVLKQMNHGKPWFEWENPSRDPAYLDLIRVKHSQEMEYHRFLQYAFYHQWRALKDYAGRKGIRIVGDLAIYVAGDSADTWAHREYFTLDEEGRPSAQAGVPPDYFTEGGQLWGNPLYEWRKLRRDGYSWWKERIANGLLLYDSIRLDHFRGFEGFWSVPAGEANAVNGRWIKGPGKHFFETLEEAFGKLPFIAEDLGFITPEVVNLMAIMGYPGMKVFQFEAEELERGGAELAASVVYSGTHDTDTLLGWYQKNRADGYQSGENLDQCYGILEKLYGSEAPWVIVPMQDVLMLDSRARMNVPGSPEGNWTWKLRKGEPGDRITRWLRSMAEQTNRNSL